MVQAKVRARHKQAGCLRSQRADFAPELIVIMFCPAPPVQVSLSPKIAQHLDLHLCRVISAGRQYDGHHIKTKRIVFHSEQAAIGTCRSRDLSLFAPVNIGLWWRKPIRRPRLHFDKAKRGRFVGDQIDFRVYDRAAQISSDR